MDVMTAPGFWSGQDRMLTVEDMENMPDDEFRYELDDGVLIVSPAPSTLHQLAVTRLAVILSTACPADLVVLAGVGVNISHFQHRVPDVAVVRADSLETVFQETPPAARGRGRLAPDPALRQEPEEGRVPGLRHPGVLDRRAGPGPSRTDRLRAAPGSYKQTAHITSDEEYRAVIPFPVTIAPSKLVTLG